VRLFTGIAIDQAVIESLSAVVYPWRLKAELHWSPPENYHVTIKFLGECAEDKLESIVTALEQGPRLGEFEMAIEGLGFFPNARSPHVIWAGVMASKQLVRLASDVDDALWVLGIPAEERRYSPHLTLARVKAGQSAAAIADEIAGVKNLRFGQFTAREFYLYRSRTGPGGSVYEKLRRFKLGCGARTNGGILNDR
jgi:RNA 2',3'-cyclic 3'-phosphodiesterase